MTLHRNLKRWWGGIYLALWAFKFLAVRFIPLESRRAWEPYYQAFLIVILICYGFWLLEESFSSRRREKGNVWHKSWPVSLILGTAILAGSVVLLGSSLASR